MEKMRGGPGVAETPRILALPGLGSRVGLLAVLLGRLDGGLLEVLALLAQVLVVLHHHVGRGVPQQLGDLGYADAVLQGVRHEGVAVGVRHHPLGKR